MKTGSSYCSQSELPLTFGLGTASKVTAIEVTWPDGRAERLAGDRLALPLGRLEERVGQGLLPLAQHVERESPGVLDEGVGVGVGLDADRHQRRLERGLGHPVDGGRGHPAVGVVPGFFDFLAGGGGREAGADVEDALQFVVVVSVTGDRAIGGGEAVEPAGGAVGELGLAA